MLVSLFNKVLVLKTSNFIEKRLQNRCFPVNIAKLRVPILKNICERLLLEGAFSKKYLQPETISERHYNMFDRDVNAVDPRFYEHGF